MLLLVAALAYWLWPRADAGQAEPGSVAAGSKQLSGAGHHTPGQADAGPQLHTPARIIGTVTTLDGKPLGPNAQAQVCLRPDRVRSGELDSPTCVGTDDGGHYRLEAVIPGALELYAGAAEHQPRNTKLTLVGGSEQTVDFMLLPGGVLIRGVVHDLAGGHVEGALVTIAGDGVQGDPSDRAISFSDDQGRFSAWVRRGRIHVGARAQGYATRKLYSSAPGPSVDVYLVPEAVLVGRVVDAQTHAPLPNVEVYPGIGGGGEFMSYTITSQGWARSDADGYFRIAGLTPGAFRPYVANASWRGRAAQTVKLGLGETSAVIELPVTAAASVRAQVVQRESGEPACIGGSASISPGSFEIYSETVDANGWVEFGGLRPGDYTVNLSCQGRFMSKLASFTLEPEGGDLDELRWVVPDGVEIRGVIVDGRGQALPGLVVLAELIPTDDDERGATARRSRSEPSDETGAFTLLGLESGSYELTLGGSSGPSLPAPVEVVLGEQDIDGLRIEAPTPTELAGRVIDDAGAAVPDITVTVYSSNASVDTRSDDDGRFVFPNLGAGHLRVVANDGRWQLDLAETEVDLEASVRAEIELVVPRGDGVIRGRVVDEGGTPLDDAFISIERQLEVLDHAPERGKLSYSAAKGRPVLSEADGSFELTGLPKGLFTVWAKQKQGGEAVRADLRPGAQIELVIDTVGSLAGVVVADASAGEFTFTITAKLADGTLEERDQWTNKDGRWRLDQLPPGRYEVTVVSDAGDGALAVELAAGQALEDLRIELQGRVTVRGRLVDQTDQSPIVDAKVRVAPPDADFSVLIKFPRVRSDADGRFTVEVPAGEMELEVVPGGSAAGRQHQTLHERIQISTESKVQDLGDIPLTPN
ncbi:carboxypeptidase-like regulatory domain-containing protein [Enhygromyxa salina]|uniref:Cna protein B-type domain protein n=1 Tax=Enhygromyxa salina TaxID=215803 RepID=A0A2S9Y3K0_9BACT|nr:carboxypeptidase-like regulatory domain-containing protein [Enhygromyxa salina]PRP99672.1 Cna protein B-type domain protein [Enhygromyxa salina]